VALIKAISDNSDQATVYRPEVEQLLNPFQYIFEEPTELPPKREINHTIPLVPNAQPECSKLMVIVTMRRKKGNSLGFYDEDFYGLFFMGLCSKRKPSFPVKDELPGKSLSILITQKT
jgi:hypothetical protein